MTVRLMADRPLWEALDESCGYCGSQRYDARQRRAPIYRDGGVFCSLWCAARSRDSDDSES